MVALTEYRQPGNPVDERSAELDLPLPHWLNDAHDDVMRLRSALGLIDAAHRLLADSKADRTALQAFAQATADAMEASEQATAHEVAELGELLAMQTEQLAKQISDMGKALDAKRVDLQAVAGATTAAQALAGDVGLRRLRQAHSNEWTNNQPLEAGVEYSLYTSEPYSRTLPAEPSVGDTIVLIDAWGLWNRRLFTLRRGNAAHVINGRAEDVLFNTNAWRVTLTYVWGNCWTLSIG